MSFNARVTYNADGTTATFSFSFSYIVKSHVKAYVNDVEDTGITFPTDSSITLSTTPSNGDTVKIQRETPSDERLTDFQDGSVLTSADLDQSADQNFYIAQETNDNVASKLGLDNADRYDAGSKRIINLADPVNDNDAVNKQFISTNLPNITTVAGISSDVTTVAGIESDVTTVADNDADVSTVATNIANVNTVATNIADVTTVANDLNEAISEIETAANDLNEATSEIDTVATNITNVNTVGTNIADVNTVAGISANITTVAGNDANITTVAGVSSDVTTVAGISSDVSAVEDIAANVTTVAGISSDVSTVAGVSSDVTTVAGVSSNVSTVATDIANVNTAATNISDINNFANRYRIGATDPTTSLDAGDLFFNTTSNTLRFYNGTAWADIDTGIQTETDPTAAAFSIALG